MKSFYGTTKKLGIDMGSSQIRIFSENKLILSESSAVAIDYIDKSVVAFGINAIVRYNQEPEKIQLIWPIKCGVMTDYNLVKSMMNYFISKALKKSASKPIVMLSIPCDMSAVVRHALVDAAIHAGVQKVFLISSSAAAAIGSGSILYLPETICSVVIGSEVTECGIFASGGLLQSNNIEFGGKLIDKGLRSFLREEYNIHISLNQAEILKKNIGESIAETGVKNSLTVRGRRVKDGVEVICELNYNEIYGLMHHLFEPAVNLVKKMLYEITPEMAEDLMINGILLSGGTALFPDIADFFASELGVPVYVSENPDISVVKGCYLALTEFSKKLLIIENGEKYYGGA